MFYTYFQTAAEGQNCNEMCCFKVSLRTLDILGPHCSEFSSLIFWKAEVLNQVSGRAPFWEMCVICDLYLYGCSLTVV